MAECFGFIIGNVLLPYIFLLTQNSSTGIISKRNGVWLPNAFYVTNTNFAIRQVDKSLIST